MKKYVCSICGYVYDEESEGATWDKVGDDYACPLCGASKDAFEEE